MRTEKRMFTRIGAFCLAAGLLAAVHSARAGHIRVTTEYRYPTDYEVIPIFGGGGPGGQGARIVGGMVIPRNFETREVGVVMSVYAEVVHVGEAAHAMTDGQKLLNGNTPLMLAATAGDHRAVERVLAGRPDVNAKNNRGSTALLGAAAGGFETIANRLIEAGADINAVSGSGLTPLTVAARNGHAAIVRTLIARGARVNSADRTGQTPLAYAVRRGHESVAEALLRAGMAKLRSRISACSGSGACLPFAGRGGGPPRRQSIETPGAKCLPGVPASSSSRLQPCAQR